MTNSNVVTTTCYRPNTNGTVEGIYSDYITPQTNTNYSPCCFSTAAYTEDNVCYQQDHTGDDSGYYMALCTDPTYQDPSCTQACTAYTKGNIVFTNKKWLCCGAGSDGNPACSNPTNETVANIPAPSALQAILASPSASSASATSSTSSTASLTTSTSTSTPTTPTTQSKATSSGGLSTGAKAGIGAGAGILAILVILFAYFFMRRSGRSHQKGLYSRNMEKDGMDDTLKRSGASSLRDDPNDYRSEMASPMPPAYRDNYAQKPANPSPLAELMSSPPKDPIHEIG